MSLRDDLIKIRELVARGPCVGHDAEDANGNPVQVTSPAAVRWCLSGAALLVTGGSSWNSALAAIRRAARLRATDYVCVWYDKTPHDRVLAVLDRAISTASP